MFKKILFLLVLIVPAFAANHELDGSHTFVTFKVNHLGISDTYGQFRKVEGNFDLDAGKLAFTIRTDSLDSNDGKRDEHLKGPDFFNVKQFPVIQFEGTKVVKGANNQYTVTGNLSIHGKKQELTVTLTKSGEGKDPWGNMRQGLTANFKVNRADYGMNFMADLIGNEVEIYFSAEGIQK